jgi:uncharacterized protein YndB with AHSA1/START domain
VREVTVHTTISAPREELFDFVQDLAGRPAIADHYLKDFRLARAMPVGKGAAARFKLRDQWAELSIREAERPRRIIEDLRWGRVGRNRAVAVWDFIREAGAVTRVELTTYSEPKTIFDRLSEVGAAGYLRRKTKMSLERLRSIFEEGSDKPLARVTIAGYEPAKAARFGGPTGLDPARPRPGEPA